MSAAMYQGGNPLGKGTGDATLTDSSLADQLAAYRRRVAGNYRPLPPDEIAKLPHGPMWVSQKIDGELWFIVSVGGETFLSNPQGSVIHGDIPILGQVGKLPDGVIIAGELHAKVEGRRARVGDLASVMGGGASAKTESIAFTAFDLVKDTGNAEISGYGDRLEKLRSYIKGGDALSVIETETPNTPAEVKSTFESKVATGDAEGLVVRVETGMIYKLKPEVKIQALIVAYTVKADHQDMVRSVLLGLIKEDGSCQILGGCGNLGSEEERKSLLNNLEAIKTESTARYASDGGGLYTFVKPELIADLTVTDLQALLSDGSRTTGMLVQHGESGWSSLGMHPAPKLIHPVITGISSEKKPDKSTAGYSQITSYLAPEKAGEEVYQKLPESSILRREVWTKAAKGQTAVRKLLVWKTNKEKLNNSFPAYVIHWTDYSPGRATALDRDVRTAPTEKAALKIAEEMIAENIKKGWEKAS